MRRFVLVMGLMPFGHGAFSFRHGAFCCHTGRGSVPAARFVVAPPIFLLSSRADGVRLKFRGNLHDPEFDGGGNLVYWYDADSQSAALPEQEKPKGPTDADVRRLADEIKSLKRPPTMMEVRTIAHKLFGKHFGSSVYDILKNDWNKYGLTVVKGDTLAQKLVVSLEQKKREN